jgi:hypothetical protein
MEWFLKIGVIALDWAAVVTFRSLRAVRSQETTVLN